MSRYQGANAKLKGVLKQQIFKANDIRGIVTGEDPELDLDGARQLGAAFVELLGLSGKTFVMGRDMRQLGKELSMAFADGARRAGASVVNLGLTSTDQLWFASGHLGLPGVQFTASHNPAMYNGMKFCMANAFPVRPGFTTELRERAGSVVIGVDAGNGMAGLIAPAVLAGRDVELIGLYMEPDGSFPNHPANPLELENLADAQAAVRQHEADLGLVFDGDADRCFLIDERGKVVDPSVITAMIAVAELTKEPGGVVVVNAITSQAVADAVAGLGRVQVSRVGHTFVKSLMAGENAIFGGEHSAHYYFREFWGADTGVLAALHVLEQLRVSAGTLSGLAARFDGYQRSGEINSTVTDHQASMELIAAAFEGRGEIEYWDGLTIRDPEAGWWVNLRPSNTEPLLRLNVEARDTHTMTQLRDEVLAIVRADEGEADE